MKPTKVSRMSNTFPFSAIVGQDEMKLAILVAAVDPSVGGVLIFGEIGRASCRERVSLNV